MTAAKRADQAAASDGQPGEGARSDAAELELVRQLAERARAEGLSLTGPGGLLGRLTKVVLEGALEGELDAHLGYAKHDPAGRDGGNSHNGHRDAEHPVLGKCQAIAISWAGAPHPRSAVAGADYGGRCGDRR